MIQNSGPKVELFTVLLIDDDPKMEETLKKIGEEENWTVRVAKDGEAGVKLACSIDADLILLELDLPTLRGVEACRQIRACGIEVPIMVITSSNDTLDKVVVLELGADDYVVKPFDSRELAARIGAHLRRSQRGIPRIKAGRMRFLGLTIDINRHEARCGSELLKLTPTEFGLLTLLAASSGRVIPRSEMVEKIWGSVSEVELRSVDAHIYRLRKKIEEVTTDIAYIHAIPGVGYTFEPRKTNKEAE